MLKYFITMEPMYKKMKSETKQAFHALELHENKKTKTISTKGIFITMPIEGEEEGSTSNTLPKSFSASACDSLSVYLSVYDMRKK